MSRIIIQLKDFYLEWSSIVHAPITFGMNKKEFELYHHDEYSANGHWDFRERMKRVTEAGTSSHHGMTVKEVISNNHAGPEETELTFDEIYQAYCLQESIKGGWLVPSH